ncbi:hypothetical protein ABW19_dt0201220 [Dactylella cylindrospora]|nr:hypothetical protein ABW19_dt0201220 [Dactylella cylindrospora]
MDIVISYYKEDLEGVKNFIASIKGIPHIQNLAPNVIIYTKNNMSDMDDIKRVTRADKVRMLPNKGREGGTYLQHIIDQWGDLANHTLFVQAEPHGPNRVVARLRGYFDPSVTGMLDLGYRELRSCNCLDCRDEYGWTDQVGFIPDLMTEAHHLRCDEDTKVSLTYKGQFIVSAKRIRALRKELYESIQEKLIGDNRIEIGGNQDRADAPFFGYTIERSWNILFQCADLTGTRDMCPGLTTTDLPFGDLRPAKPEDCSCLDG